MNSPDDLERVVEASKWIAGSGLLALLGRLVGWPAIVAWHKKVHASAYPHHEADHDCIAAIKDLPETLVRNHRETMGRMDTLDGKIDTVDGRVSRLEGAQDERRAQDGSRPRVFPPYHPQPESL